MRGKGYTTAAESEENRITPAYAGKSLYNTSNAICIQDHPRLCGEKQLTSSSGIQQIRITPAYAGKSASQSTPAGT